MSTTRAKTSSVSQGLPKSRSLLAGNAPILSGSYESIATQTVTASGGAVSVEFTSIPSTYKHLELRWLARSTGAVANTTVQLIMNSDTGTNYYSHYLYGNGASAAAGGQQLNWITGFDMPGANATASIFGAGVLSILDYTNTNKNKVTRNLGGFDANGSGIVALGSGLWNNTAAITTLKLTCNNNNFAQYSHFALYGIR